MATTARRYKSTISFEQVGEIRRGSFRLATYRAQEKNAKLAEESASALAKTRVKHSPSVDNRGRRRYANSMTDAYVGRVLAYDKRTFSLSNTTVRGRIFEGGARAHPIRQGGRIIPGKPLYFRSPKPSGPLVSRRVVMHPGQKPNPVMGDTIRDLAPRFEENIADEIDRSME